MPLSPKEVVAKAKEHFTNVFGSETEAPTLEEIWYEEGSDLWCVTLGIRHQTITVRRSGGLLNADEHKKRIADYKVVRLSSDGSFISIKDRTGVAA